MMELPKGNKRLEEVFKKARAPEITEFRGEYAVRMLTRLPSLHWLKHRKSFSRAEGGVTGQNILLRGCSWGEFFLEEGVMPGREQLKVVVINYGTRGNTVVTRGIRDLVRAVDGERLYLGRLNLLIGGRLRFLGYFSLERLER
jgi:hypothetical protein